MCVDICIYIYIARYRHPCGFLWAEKKKKKTTSLSEAPLAAPWHCTSGPLLKWDYHAELIHDKFLLRHQCRKRTLRILEGPLRTYLHLPLWFWAVEHGQLPCNNSSWALFEVEVRKLFSDGSPRRSTWSLCKGKREPFGPAGLVGFLRFPFSTRMQ